LEVPAAVVLVVTLKVPGMRDLPIRLFARGGLDRRRAVVAAARSLAAAIAIVLLAGEAAWAACTPAAADNVTATCTGATTNQGGGLPGSTTGNDGYGTGVETGVTVNVAGGASNTVSGNSSGIFLGDATVANNAGASITGGLVGIFAQTGFANVTNSGSITGTFLFGIAAATNATVTNNAGASITGGQVGIGTNTGFVTVTNSGSITGTIGSGISAATDATVTNNAGASITGGFDGIGTNTGFITVTNSSSITGTTGSGISANTNATVTNNAGASIAGGVNGISAVNGSANVNNFGSITGPNNRGIFAGTDATVTNNAGASIAGGLFGIEANTGFATVTNSGSITGGMGIGISGRTNATVTNNAGASIAGGQDGIIAFTGFANVINSGSIASAANNGIFAGTDATVTNNAGASIAGGGDGIAASNGFATITNSGSITGTVGAIFAGTNATVTNNAGASIAGGLFGIEANTGFADVTNSGSITGSGLFGIAAATNATVTNTAGASIAGGLIGIIAGSGGSSVFNAGTISGGTAAIQFGGTGNTLTLAPGSVISGAVLGTGSDIFQLGGTGAATFDVSSLGPAAQYQGFGTFNKIDSSVWTLTGTSTFAGPVNVEGGTLVVNGDITSMSGVTVNAGTLGGSGTVGNTQINAGGIFAPGSGAPGSSMTVAGNLAFQSGATYLVQLNSAAASFASVSGTAALAGTVRVASPTGSYRFNSNDTILTSTGLNGTRFDGLATPVGIAGSLAYTSNVVMLNLTSALGQIAGLNINQRAVGAGLDAAFNAQGSNSGLLGAIFSGNIPQNLTQASGETATGSQQTTFDAMNQFMGVMTDPFVAGRGDGFGASGGAPSGYASTQKTGAARDANAMFVKAPVVPFEQRWSTWTAGFGGSQTTDGNAAVGSNSTTSSIAGTAVGADYRFSPDTIAGFALAGGGTSFGVAGSGSGHSDLFQAGAFVRHNAGPAYITAALAYGWQDITTNRTVTIAGIDQLQARFNANAFSGRVEGGYRFVLPWIGGIGITPYAAAQFTTFDLPAYAEQAIVGANTFALSYGANSVTDTRSELGIRTDKSFAMPDSVLTLRGRLAWAHDYNPDGSISATFQTLPGASFVVNGAAQASDAALTTASAEIKWMNGWSAAATFEGEFSDVTRSYAGKGEVRYAW
jgi:uncharacterized protein with beta-barrel porin domain